jgi:hypothetical protein
MADLDHILTNCELYNGSNNDLVGFCRKLILDIKKGLRTIEAPKIKATNSDELMKEANSSSPIT